MIFQQTTCTRSPYFLVTLAFISLLFSVGCSKHLVRAPDKLASYDITFTDEGVEAVDYQNMSQQEWWESFYRHICDLESGDIGYYIGFKYDSQFEKLLELMKKEGKAFYTDQLGMVEYLDLGDNSAQISNVVYLRIVGVRSLSASKQLELLIEKGVEVMRETIPEQIRSSATLTGGSKEQGTPWILYRFKISRLIEVQNALFNKAFLLSSDKYHCITSIDGLRRMRLAEGKKRYGDLILPESKGYATLEKLFTKALADYLEHYAKPTESQ
ncbi:MAG: hypothetical protein JSU72_20895 [Deltaproteobacteria bacterium]|nr:MAG: hypothetical protein JSU72_20895 [Deltaproteobacteria bacterium]